MVDRIDTLVPDGGPHRLGFIAGSKAVDPGAWFFQAHFLKIRSGRARWGWNRSCNCLKSWPSSAGGRGASDRRSSRQAWASGTAGSTAARCSRANRRSRCRP